MSTEQSTTIRPQIREIDGLAIRFAESEGRAAQSARALLLCPWPESLYAFEPTWRQLAAQAHLLAIDLPGFGHSERRNELMAPRAMGEFILRLADEFGLEQPHVVAPDVGTAAALFAAAMAPGRLRSLVVGSGAAAVPLQLGSSLKERVRGAQPRCLSPNRRPRDGERVDRQTGALPTFRSRPGGLSLSL